MPKDSRQKKEPSRKERMKDAPLSATQFAVLDAIYLSRAPASEAGISARTYTELAKRGLLVSTRGGWKLSPKGREVAQLRHSTES
jgi:hypothetical protein